MVGTFASCLNSLERGCVEDQPQQRELSCQYILFRLYSEPPRQRTAPARPAIASREGGSSGAVPPGRDEQSCRKILFQRLLWAVAHLPSGQIRMAIAHCRLRTVSSPLSLLTAADVTAAITLSESPPNPPFPRVRAPLPCLNHIHPGCD